MAGDASNIRVWETGDVFIFDPDAGPFASGDVPADIWPRRTFKEGDTPGARAIWAAARKRGVPIFALAHECNLPHRSFYRWAAGETHPHSSSIRTLNKRLGLTLSVADFEVAVPEDLLVIVSG